MYVARFRLRFLLQELDLIGPVVTLGRSSECQITLEDPLVSRVHAELTVTDTYVRVRDLGSRNGVRVNGELIGGETSLQHNDRLRLGSQDMVFLALAAGSDAAVRLSRATGSMAHCRKCERPFPGECAACPHCGERTTSSFAANNGPETITGVELGDAPSWTFRLIAEVVERALTAGRAPEAERMLERAARDIDARVVRGRKIGAEQVLEASRFALRLAKLKMRPEWATWALGLHDAEQLAPSLETVDLLASLDPLSFEAVRPALETLWSHFRGNGTNGISAEERASERRIAELLHRTASTHAAPPRASEEG
jgi:hypothetical protein